ncbi:class I SAM-dependent methyltransferase [Acetobacterium tundrae]|uniref:Methyltransferase domain-containing protein n=1 Tax=Acetobacterium tundrae TaxID=132932 RepID=A0ABR6WP44_9FIRM|nr:class I SAM-dependent methyltransferase [Acetobacterium tundrae]MBC3798273.1 methyltransferase domain-containing protein [Acetobacterium tundrae]
MNNCQPTNAYFGNVAYQWDILCRHNSEKISTILGLANIKDNSRILDIATGTGILIPHLLNYEPAEIIAIDLSELMIRQARKNFKQSKVKFKDANFYQYNQTGFDFAIVYNAYPHFADKDVFARQLSACLNSGGRFMIAHSESKDSFNARRSEERVRKMTSSLNDAVTESKHFNTLFDIDIRADGDELYIISGIKL